MFTRRELEVLQLALSNWHGVYSSLSIELDELSTEEVEYNKKMVKCRDGLLARVEEILLEHAWESFK